MSWHLYECAIFALRYLCVLYVCVCVFYRFFVAWTVQTLSFAHIVRVEHPYIGATKCSANTRSNAHTYTQNTYAYNINQTIRINREYTMRMNIELLSNAMVWLCARTHMFSVWNKRPKLDSSICIYIQVSVGKTKKKWVRRTNL